MKTYKSVALTKKLNPFSVTYHISYVEPVLKTARAAGISECLPKTLKMCIRDRCNAE